MYIKVFHVEEAAVGGCIIAPKVPYLTTAEKETDLTNHREAMVELRRIQLPAIPFCAIFSHTFHPSGG